MNAKAIKAPEREPERALMIGGPPGDSFVSMRRSFKKHGVDIIERVERVPVALNARVTLVLACIDMMGDTQNQLRAAAALAKRCNVKYAVAHLSWSRSVENLQRAGVVTDPIVTIEEEKEEMPVTEPKRVTGLVALPQNPEALRAFLRELPPELRGVVAEEGARINKEREGFVTNALAAVDRLDDDGLLSFCNRASATLIERLDAAIKAAKR